MKKKQQKLESTSFALGTIGAVIIIFFIIFHVYKKQKKEKISSTERKIMAIIIIIALSFLTISLFTAQRSKIFALNLLFSAVNIIFIFA